MERHIGLHYYYFILFFLLFFPNICDYKGRTCFVVTFPSLSLSPLIGPWSMCLLFCFVCFDVDVVMLCVVCVKKKKKVDNKRKLLAFI